MCEAFNNFNHLLKIDNDLFNFEIQGTRTYKEYKLNNPVTRDLEEIWLDNWVPYQLCDHICEPYRFKNGIAKWPTCSLDVDGFCNGGSYLGSKDKAPEVIKTFLKKIRVLLQASVILVRIDNGTEFKNQVLQEYFNSVGISHQASSVRTHQPNGVVERRNCTLVEAARTINPDISFLHVLWAISCPKNDREDIEKLGEKGDISFFIGYSANSCTYRVYNRRTKKIIETMNVTFDELSTMAFEQSSLNPRLQSMILDKSVQDSISLMLCQQ
nr:hypothetical protein [Tanacetum cinerariifolium]